MKISRCIVLCFFFFFGVGSPFSSEGEKTASWYWQHGLSVARTSDPDSAFRYLENSFSKGLSDDSLYYLWAEIYLYKGIPDTALALNLSIKPLSVSPVKKLALEQRYLIYSMLGWKKEASALLDSAGNSQSSTMMQRLLPECMIYLSGGGYSEYNVTDKEYPYPRTTDSSESLKNGNGIATLRLGWNIPAGRTQKLQIGTRARYSSSRFSYALQTSRPNDSGNTSIGAYLRYSLFSNKLAVNYTFSRKKDYNDTKTFVHNTSASYMFSTADYLGTIEGSYQYEAPVKEHYFYVMSWWDRFFGKKHDVSFDLLLSGFSAYNFSYDKVGCAYFKDTMLYFDPLYTDVFPVRLSDSLANVRLDTLYVSTIALSYWSVTPHVRYEYQFNKSFSAGFGGGYALTWYRNRYKWADFRYPSDSIPENGSTSQNFIAFDDVNRNYYWVKAKGVFQAKLDTLSIIFHSERRIDQALSIDLFFKTALGVFGDVIFDISAHRNFSTLMDSAPVDIQKWYGEVTLSWFFRFKPGRAG